MDFRLKVLAHMIATSFPLLGILLIYVLVTNSSEYFGLFDILMNEKVFVHRIFVFEHALMLIGTAFIATYYCRGD